MPKPKIPHPSAGEIRRIRGYRKVGLDRKVIEEAERRRLRKKYGKFWRRSEEARAQWLRQGNKQLKRLYEAKDEYGKAGIIRELGKIKYTPAESTIHVNLMKAKTLSLRTACIGALGEVGRADSIKTLLPFLDPKSRFLQAIAERGLPEFKNKLQEQAEREREHIQRGETRQFIEEALQHLREKGRNGRFYRGRVRYTYMFCAAKALIRIVGRHKLQLTKGQIEGVRRAAGNARRSAHPRLREVAGELEQKCEKILKEIGK